MKGDSINKRLQQVIQLSTEYQKRYSVHPHTLTPLKTKKTTFFVSCLILLISMEFSDLIQTPKLESVILHSQLRDPIVGSFCLTFSHIIIAERKDDRKENFELWVIFCDKFFLQAVTNVSFDCSFCIRISTQWSGSPTCWTNSLWTITYRARDTNLFWDAKTCGSWLSRLGAPRTISMWRHRLNS